MLKRDRADRTPLTDSEIVFYWIKCLCSGSQRYVMYIPFLSRISFNALIKPTGANARKKIFIK